jgi:hypothetical protein
MIPELYLPIPTLHSPLILHLALRNSLLQHILLLHIPNLPRNQALTQTQRSKREAIPQFIRRGSVDLACYSAGCVAHRLLETDGGCAAVVRRYVYVEPGELGNEGVSNCWI